MGPRGVDWSWANTVRAHSIFRLLHCHTAHESVHPAFRPAIRRILCQTNHPRFRASRNDIAAALLQMRQHETRHHECRANVHPDRFVEIGDGIILGHCVIEKNAGVVHQHIDPLEFFDGQIDALPSRMFLRNIAAEGDRLTAVVTNRLRDIFDWIVRQSADYYASAFSGRTYAQWLHRCRCLLRSQSPPFHAVVHASYRTRCRQKFV